MMQYKTSLDLVVSRKTSLADLAHRNITTLEQLAALSLEEIQSIVGIGEKSAPQVKALASAYLENKALRFSDLPPKLHEASSFLAVRVDPDTQPQQPWGFCLMVKNTTYL